MDQSIECILCRDKLSEPMITPCGHTYCRKCIIQCKYQNKLRCPESRQVFEEKELKSNIIVQRILDAEKKLSSYELKVSLDAIRIVTSLDISGSMNTTISGFQNGQKESHGLTKLDLTKHAVLTVAHGLYNKDLSKCGYLEIQTFSREAKVLMEMTRMDSQGLILVKNYLDVLTIDSCTNLWNGLHLALTRASKYKNCPVYLLTDGVASSTPPRGFENMTRKLLTKLDNIPILRCMGFGEDIDSFTLQQLSSLTPNGTFIYIPDEGFLGTAIQHVFANTIVTKINSESDEETTLRKKLVGVLENLLDKIQQENSSYYSSRSEQVDEVLLSTIWKEYLHEEDTPELYKEKQIEEAIEKKYILKWGRHYLRSLKDAMKYRECVNFKDALMQKFGKMSRGKEWEDILDYLDWVYCEKLDPPKPSKSQFRFPVYTAAQNPLLPISMRSYSQSSNPCYYEKCEISTKNGIKTCENIQKGDIVYTGNSWDTIEYILKTKIKTKCEFVKVLDLIITPWHPIFLKKWVYPKDVGQKIVLYTNYIYSFVLKNRSPISIGSSINRSVQTITLGHNRTEEILSHALWGTDKIVNIITEKANNQGIFEITSDRIQKQNNRAINII